MKVEEFLAIKAVVKSLEQALQTLLDYRDRTTLNETDDLDVNQSINRVSNAAVDLTDMLEGPSYMVRKDS